MPVALPEIECSIGNVLRLGDDIELVILDAPGKAVRIGVKAPADVSILRKEIVGVPHDGCSPSGDHIRN